MVSMEVTIHSVLPTVDGGLTIPTDPSQTVESLIIAFCNGKNIPRRSEYVIRDKEQVLIDSKKTLQQCGISNGEILLISVKELAESEFCWSQHCNQWLILAVVLCVMGVIGITLISFYRAKSGHQPQDFGVVLDAGSSHTQIYVYKWNANKQNGTGLVQQVYTERAEGGGISNYSDYPAEAGPSLRPILENAADHVPSSQVATTPVWLGATAGMRLLQASEPDKSDAILKSVRDEFERHPFYYNNTETQVKILNGSDEGTFSWVTTNFLSNAFDDEVSSSWFSIYSAPPENTYGALDLGGASTQITFIPEDEVKEDYAEQVKMYGTTYTVYSHSYLCYGINEAFRKLSAVLVKEALSQNATITQVDNPCQPAGNTSTMHFSEIFEAPCTNGTLPSNSTQKNTTFTFMGTSNSSECNRVTQSIFTNFTCDDPPCGFNNVHQPHVWGTFYAFSGYWTTMNFLNATEASLEEFNNIIEDFCSKNWSQISVMPALDKYLVKYCFNAHHINTLLTKGYKFNTTTWKQIKFSKTIHGADLGWSLGYMLNATNLYPVRMSTSYISLSSFVLLLLLFLIFLAVGCAFALHGRQRNADKRKSRYERLSTYGAI